VLFGRPKYPLVLLRAGGKEFGYLFTKPTFKPLGGTFWQVQFPLPFQPPCSAKLKFQRVPESHKRMPMLECVDAVINTIVGLMHVARASDFSYKLVEYRSEWQSPLQNLIIREVNGPLVERRKSQTLTTRCHNYFSVIPNPSPLILTKLASATKKPRRPFRCSFKSSFPCREVQDGWVSSAPHYAEDDDSDDDETKAPKDDDDGASDIFDSLVKKAGSTGNRSRGIQNAMETLSFG
jgi:hypothetical protein